MVHRNAVVSAARLALLAGLAGGIALLGCAARNGDGPANEAALSRGTASLDRSPYDALGYRLEWAGFATLVRGELPEFVQPLGEATAILGDRGTLSVLSAVSGEARWTSSVGTELTDFIGVVRDGNTVAVATDSQVIGLDINSGSIVRRFNLARVASSRPLLAGPLYIFGSATGAVFAQIGASGLSAWQYATRGPVEFEPVLVGSQHFGVVSRAGQVLILDSSGSASASYSMFGGAGAKPAADDRSLYVASLDQSIYAFDVFGNRPRWRTRTQSPLKSQPAVVGNKLILEVPEIGLVGLTTEKGEQVWSNSKVRGRVVGTRKGNALVWDGKTVTIIDPATGDVINSAALPDVAILQPERFDDGPMLAVRANGDVFRFQPR